MHVVFIIVQSRSVLLLIGSSGAVGRGMSSIYIVMVVHFIVVITWVLAGRLRRGSQAILDPARSSTLEPEDA